MKYSLLSFTLLLSSALAFGQQPASPLSSSFLFHSKLKAETELGLEWIQVGPTLNSARVEAVQVNPNNPAIMYAAFGSGGLWKTGNGGLSWKPIFENMPSLGIGDIALAPSNPDIIYVGTGESLKKARNFTMPGNGIYRSNNAGETWKHLGLEDSWHIGEIAVHPTNPDIVIVAVLGHFWSSNNNRGLYRTEDGGKSWARVLHIDETTGGNDVVFAKSDPNKVYASMWHNYPDTKGSNSGVFISNNGGKTWSKAKTGLPKGKNIGRIGVAASFTNANKAYALVDNLGNKGGATAEVYKTIDGGANWERTHKEDFLIFPGNGIGWYFADIYTNPQNDEEIYGLGVRMGRSTDGGKTFEGVEGDIYHLFPNPSQTLHLDHCELWINPANPSHIVVGNDGGLYSSQDRGETWLHHNNIPTGEFYDITLSNETPYKIYGGVQDDATVYGPASELNPKYAGDWKYVWVDAWSGGDGCVTQVDPEDPNTVYFSMQNGAAMRKDMKADTSVSIRPRLPKDVKGRAQFNFVAPYFISPHDSKTLYHGGNYAFKSTNRGDDWEVISPDLTESSDGGKKSTAAGAFVESVMKPGLIYLGTDKGAFWVSKNDGVDWQEHSAGLPNAYIRSIYPSRHKEGRVYLAATGINYDDLNGYLFVSEDYGATWTSIMGNLPNQVMNVIIEDDKNADLLFVGTYRGVYMSSDRGKAWSYLGKEMPDASVSDMEIHEPTDDLVVSTHGRGIYMTNLEPLRTAVVGSESSNLFSVPTAIRPWFNDTHNDPDWTSHSKVPITYFLEGDAAVTLEIRSEDKTIYSKKLNGTKGLNQFRWDLISKKTESLAPYFVNYNTFIEAGMYEVVLTTGEQEFKQQMEVVDYVK